MGNGGVGGDGRRVVPIGRVFPWWYVVGAVVTIGVLLLLDPEGNPAVVAFWGPAIGIALRDRLEAARDRADRGLPLDRAALLSPPWLEPVVAVLLTVFAVGLGLLLHALWGPRTIVTIGVGSACVVVSAAGYLGLLLGLRAARRRRSPGGERQTTADEESVSGAGQ